VIVALVAGEPVVAPAPFLGGPAIGAA
jgi:hypothetical protein